jgi:hypothetical protein
MNTSKNLKLNLHTKENEMTTIMLHKVMTLELTETNALTTSSGSLFWRRKLIVTDDKDNRTEITLFSENKEPLEIKEVA